MFTEDIGGVLGSSDVAASDPASSDSLACLVVGQSVVTLVKLGVWNGSRCTARRIYWGVDRELCAVSNLNSKNQKS